MNPAPNDKFAKLDRMPPAKAQQAANRSDSIDGFDRMPFDENVLARGSKGVSGPNALAGACRRRWGGNNSTVPPEGRNTRLALERDPDSGAVRIGPSEHAWG